MIFKHFFQRIFRFFVLENFEFFVKNWPIRPIRPADWPMWPISKYPADDALFKKIYNLAQNQVVPEISSFL